MSKKSKNKHKKKKTAISINPESNKSHLQNYHEKATNDFNNAAADLICQENGTGDLSSLKNNLPATQINISEEKIQSDYAKLVIAQENLSNLQLTQTSSSSPNLNEMEERNQLSHGCIDAPAQNGHFNLSVNNRNNNNNNNNNHNNIHPCNVETSLDLLPGNNINGVPKREITNHISMNLNEEQLNGIDVENLGGLGANSSFTLSTILIDHTDLDFREKISTLFSFST